MRAPPQNVNRVEDTARWVAIIRALESERPDALFHDPFARKLGGDTGARLVRELSGRAGGTWPVVARTHIIDGLVLEAVRDGADAVLNLAAGLDTRPYRMQLPPGLTWVEVDHAEVLAEKETLLRGDTPVCRLERVAQDLSVIDERRTLFARLGGRFQRMLVMTEGLLCYLPREAVLTLARDILQIPPAFRWLFDLNNTAVNEFLAKRTRHSLQGTARMQFGSDEGPLIFEPLGWKAVSATSIFKTAGKLKRLPFPMSLFARLPEKPYGTPGRPWSGVCVLEPRR